MKQPVEPFLRQLSDPNAPGLRLAALHAILDERTLEFAFQPIADVRRASVYGYEALMRGPEGSALRGPEELLRAARAAGRLAELECVACVGAIGAFARLCLKGKLFLNLSAPLIEHFARDNGAELVRRAEAVGIAPDRLVIELTEHERVEDVAGLRAAITTLSALGIMLALDDFGDGRSSLRLWVELQPQLVKLDKFFVRGLVSDIRKVEVIRSVLRLAEVLGTPLVAEGIEDPAELAVLRDLGCCYAQGYCLGRPSKVPEPDLLPAALAVLRSEKGPVLPAPSGGTGPAGFSTDGASSESRRSISSNVSGNSDGRKSRATSSVRRCRRN